MNAEIHQRFADHGKAQGPHERAEGLLAEVPRDERDDEQKEPGARRGNRREDKVLRLDGRRRGRHRASSSSTAANSPMTRDSSNRSAVSRARRAMRSRSARSPTRRWTASPSARMSLGGTRRPFSPSMTKSR